MTGSHCLLGNLTTWTVYPWPSLPAAEVGTDWLFIYYLQCQRLPLACSVKMDLWHLPTSSHQLARWMCGLSGRGRWREWMCGLSGRGRWREAEGKLRPPSWVLQGRLGPRGRRLRLPCPCPVTGLILPPLLYTGSLACFPCSRDYMFVCFLLTDRETFKWQLISKLANRLESLKILSHQ